MPTGIPRTAARAAAACRLSWPDTARLLFLLARMRWFDSRLSALHRRLDREGGDLNGPAFLILARRWLATHEAIGKLLGCPVPRHVAQVRAILRVPLLSSSRDQGQAAQCGAGTSSSLRIQRQIISEE